MVVEQEREGQEVSEGLSLESSSKAKKEVALFGLRVTDSPMRATAALWAVVNGGFFARAEDYSTGLIKDDDLCAAIATPSDTSYWDAITSCGPCVRKGCGYCLSTLQCMGGDQHGPRAGSMPCPEWVWNEEASCPPVPECSTLLSCGECATHENCAWCANSQECMTVEDTFDKDCRGAVFDAPCPASFTPGLGTRHLNLFLCVHMYACAFFSFVFVFFAFFSTIPLSGSA